MAHQRWLVLFVIILFAVTQTGRAQKASNWRTFKAVDKLRESVVITVTVSSRGNIWVRHSSEVESISRLDGYSVKTLPSPGEGNYPVYESRSGQLWSLYTDGLVLYKGGQWVACPLELIRAEFAKDPLRTIRFIPLLPAEVDRVFFLLPDRLMEYDAGKKQATVLKYASQTKLAKFTSIVEARDGDVWIAGGKGLAKLPGPVRRLGSETVWQEFIWDESLQSPNVQRLFEDDEGGITTVAETVANNEKVIVHFDGHAWSTQSVAGEKIRYAWRGVEQTYWAQTRDTLLRFENGHKTVVEKGEILTGQQSDVAVEPKGVFWLATSEGLVRYAPLPWRTPPGVAQVDSLVHTILEDRSGRLWFASTSGLLLFQNDQWERFPWPPDFESSFRPNDAIYSLPDDSLAIGADDRPLMFDAKTRQFRNLVHTSGRRIRKLVGQFKDGGLCLQTGSEDTSSPLFHLEKYDGQTFQPFLESKPDWGLGNAIFFLHEANNGDVWLGGNAGVGVYRDNKLQSFGRKEGYLADRGLCWLEIDAGKIWVGGGEMILEYNGKTWSIVRSELDRVNSMMKGRDGSIWVAANNGLFRYAEGSWVANAVDEGLPSSSVYKVWEDRRGKIWAGTARGLSLYYATADIDPPRTAISRLEVPQETSASDTATLVFHGTDKWKYTPAERLLYSYRLDQGQWSPYSVRSTVSFEDLPAGKHRVEARAMDRNWNKEPDPAFFEFVSVVPWHKDPRLMAITLAGLVITLFLAGLAINRHLRLRRSYAAVGRIVAQRTQELEQANQELLHGQKMKALGTLTAGVAHDFNNILSIVKGSVQIIEGNLENKEKIQTRVNRIKTVVDQGAGIVKAMLGLSRFTDQQKTPCDVNLLVAETIKLLGDRFLHEVSVAFEPGTDLPGVKAVKELVQQMLLNLLINAADAMSGHGQIRLRTGSLERLPAHLVLPPAPAEEFVYISVQDFGCGIAPEILPRIFEPFFTTKAFSTRRGTGLGLSMVYEMAKGMGYGLLVESLPGKGSTFTIILPAEAHAKNP